MYNLVLLFLEVFFLRVVVESECILNIMVVFCKVNLKFWVFYKVYDRDCEIEIRSLYYVGKYFKMSDCCIKEKKGGLV